MSFPGSVLLNQGDIYKQSATQIHPLGTRGYTRDGRVFRYSRNGGVALVRGKLVQSAVNITGVDTTLLGTTHYATTNSTRIQVMPSTKGLFSTADAYKDGLLYVSDTTASTGQGQYVQIYSHTKSTSTATAVQIYLRQGDVLTKGLTTKAELGVQKNRYDDVVVYPVAATGIPLGVPPRAITIAYYFWLQTWGPACVLCGAALTYDNVCVPSTAATGTFLKMSTKSTATGTFERPRLGHALEVGAAGEYTLVELMLAP